MFENENDFCDSKKYTYEENINAIYSEYLKRTTRVIQYTLYNSQTSLVITRTRNLLNSGCINDDLNLLEKYIYRLDDTKYQLNKQRKNYEDINNENGYIQVFQYFEIYISDIMKYLYYKNPNLMSNKKFNKNQNLIKNIIKKVKEEIQINNISYVLKKIDDIVNKNINITDEEEKKLKKISSIRNIIIHNDGIVNKIFINKMKNLNINTFYKEGDNISKDLEKFIEEEEDLLDNIAERTYKLIKKIQII